MALDLSRARTVESRSNRTTLPRLATIAVAVAVIYFAADVLLPLSIAVLITFALSPLATRLRKLGLPNLLSVLVVVGTTFVMIGLFVLVVGIQLGDLARNLPMFQANIITKVENLRAAGSEDGMFSRLSNMITEINAEISEAVPEQDQQPAIIADAPLPVEVVENQSPLQTLQNLVMPLISPIATIGLVIVVVIFMLLEREDLRDRFIKLLGSNDLHRTTQVLQDAGQKVGQYLLVQLLVNIIYAVPIGIGLWLIGVPNAILWGLLTLVLRFVPYIGSLLAAAFPLFLAFAVSPDWTTVIWTIALFGIVELITSNAIEPYLYGSRTGVSPLAIIVSAIFWTWVWGPMGLVLSTPLTVCLVVLGRHIPQFEVFNIMFGDDPVLVPHARLYQRLLVGDGLEATFRAEEALETQYLREYYRDVGIPALLIAQNDHDRGVLTRDQQNSLAEAALAMVTDLAHVVDEELAELRTPETDAATTEPQSPAEVADLPGTGYGVICVGGRNTLDDAAAAMLGQVLAAEGAAVTCRPYMDLAPSRFQSLGMADNDCLVLMFLDPEPSRASLLHIRRIKTVAPHLRVGVMICEMPPQGQETVDLMTIRPASVAPATLQIARDIGADFAVSSFGQMTDAAFSQEAPRAVPPARNRRRQTHPQERVGISA